MMNFDITKEYRLPISESLRGMRIAKCLLDCGDGIFVDDRLETESFIKIYEYLGGTFYVPMSAGELEHSSKVVPIAGIKVSVKEAEQIVQVDKIFCEFGSEEYIAKLLQQVMDFADFYSLKVSINILDLRKNIAVKKVQKCRFVDVLSW